MRHNILGFWGTITQQPLVSWNGKSLRCPDTAITRNTVTVQPTRVEVTHWEFNKPDTTFDSSAGADNTWM
jgi:hypothetical protein